MNLSIVIPTFQRCNSVKRALTALNTQTLPAEDFEVIVLIDGTENGNREMVNNLKSPYKQVDPKCWTVLGLI